MQLARPSVAFYFVFKTALYPLHLYLQTWSAYGLAGDGPQNWDPDLARPAAHFEALAKTSPTCRAVWEALENDLHDFGAAAEV